MKIFPYFCKRLIPHLLAGCLIAVGLHPARAQEFKTSCVSWSFHGFGPGLDPRPVIDTVADLGFDGIQLMINHPSDLDQVWTDAMIESVRQKLQQRKLELVSLVPFFVCYPDLGSSDPQKVQKNLTAFERCCRIAQRLGTRRLEMIGPYFSEFNNTARGNPYFEYKLDLKSYKPGDKLTLTTPDHSNWEAIWTRTVKVIGTCSAIARRYGLQLVVEPHIHSVVPDTNGFLLMWKELNDANIRLNSDAGWATQQCESPLMNVYRTQKHLEVMQFRDVDPTTRNFVPMGKGVVNLDHILDALRKTSFRGYVSFEEVFMPSARQDAMRFLKLVKSKATVTSSR